MTDPEITALAREYAAETVSHTRLSTTIADDAEDVIRFLLRRFCLAEKNKAITEYKKVVEAVEAKRKWNITLSEEKLAKADLLFDLFPEIAKEVQG